MKNLKISIIIPIHNAGKTLRRCLNSVLNQTYQNYEVIVVDNNSTDETKDIIKKFRGRSEKIRYFFELHTGRSSARNAGIKEAEGEIIAMTDADCLVPENWINELTKPIIYENESAVTGSEKNLIKNYWAKNIQKTNSDFVKRNINGKYISHIDTKNFAIKSSIMKELMFDSTLKALEDFELYLRLKRITKIRFLPAVKVGHRHPFSFKKLVKTNFARGYWAKKIFEKHKKNISLKDEPMVESMSFTNFLLFFPWIIFQFIKRPAGEAYFTLIADLSFKLGAVWNAIEK